MAGSKKIVTVIEEFNLTDRKISKKKESEEIKEQKANVKAAILSKVDMNSDLLSVDVTS